MSTPSIAVAASFRDECNALPGFLESASHFFDEIFLADCSMDMTPSTDGSLDIIRKWGMPDPPLWNLSDGFGAVRSQLVQSVKSDWVIVLDIDERMQVTAPVYTCTGHEAYPEVQHPSLHVQVVEPAYNQRQLLNEMIVRAEKRRIKTIRFRRRHWFDFSYQRPTQNFVAIPDWQLRCMKARSTVGFRTIPRMHEAAFDSATGRDPDYLAEDPMRGPFIDHFHCKFKCMEPDQRRADIAAYDALDRSDKHTPIPA